MKRSQKPKPRKEQRICPLCGVTFFSNKKLYCSPYHAMMYRSIRRGRTKIAEMVKLLLERGENGARIDGFWASALSEFNWLENAETAGFKRLSKHGLDTIKQLHKEQRK